jgi:predicted ribosome quality control (RQC) complex YloA/Tae2 family protein
MSDKSISSLDLFKLTKELLFLNGGFVRNVKSEKNGLYLLIYNKEEFWLKIVPGKYVAITKSKPTETVEFPFTAQIKSELKGKRINLSMHGSDRILDITSDDLKLVIELFSNGNVILVKDGKIEQAMFNRNYGSRSISAGLKFEYPKPNPDVFNMAYEAFSVLLRSSDKSNLIKAVASDLAIGGLYTEELFYRAGIDREMKPSSASAGALTKLYETLKALLDEPPKPNIVDDRVLAITELRHIKGERKYFDSISDALEYLFREVPKEKQNVIVKSTVGIEKALGEYNTIISYLQNDYEGISRAIEVARDSRKEIGDRIKELNSLGWLLEGKSMYRNDDRTVKIDITKSVLENQSDYYEKTKKLKRSLAWKSEIKEKPKRLKLKPSSSWYSKYRWFFTSTGNLVVIGRDNEQNISLIKKHMENDDIVLHADIFGSPFGIVKPDKNHKIDAAAVNEAATMVACYSSAWKGGAGNYDVYWVKPAQVSTSPPSGESLKKGAFYIEGHREYIKNVPIEMYLKIDFDQEGYQVLGVPYKPTDNFVSIVPGNKRRDEVIAKIIRVISEKARLIVDRDAFDRVIPSGQVSIKKINISERLSNVGVN